MKKSLMSAVALTALVAFGGSAWADILIGVAGPITGPNAAFGAQLQKGAEQAAADINAAGGINGEQAVFAFRPPTVAPAVARPAGLALVAVATPSLRKTPSMLRGLRHVTRFLRAS